MSTKRRRMAAGNPLSYLLVDFPWKSLLPPQFLPRARKLAVNSRFCTHKQLRTSFSGSREAPPVHRSRQPPPLRAPRRSPPHPKQCRSSRPTHTPPPTPRSTQRNQPRRTRPPRSNRRRSAILNSPCTPLHRPLPPRPTRLRRRSTVTTGTRSTPLQPLCRRSNSRLRSLRRIPERRKQRQLKFHTGLQAILTLPLRKLHLLLHRRPRRSSWRRLCPRLTPCIILIRPP